MNYEWESLENNEDIVWWRPLVSIFDPKTMLSCFSFKLLTAIVSVDCLNLADLLFTEVTVLPVHWDFLLTQLQCFLLFLYPWTLSWVSVPHLLPLYRPNGVFIWMGAVRYVYVQLTFWAWRQLQRVQKWRCAFTLLRESKFLLRCITLAKWLPYWIRHMCMCTHLHLFRC